jgi:senataxin
MSRRLDPNQLPPTVLSRAASDAGYNQSLFVRMMRQNRDAVNLLSCVTRAETLQLTLWSGQHSVSHAPAVRRSRESRLHARDAPRRISTFPSNEFYEGRLRDGADMATKTAAPWHANPLFPPYSFMHVIGGSEQAAGRSHSILNPQEASIAVLLYDALIKGFPDVNFSGRVGIITTYRAQCVRIRNLPSYSVTLRTGCLSCKSNSASASASLSSPTSTSTPSTVSRCARISRPSYAASPTSPQGQEKDIIILSCVRGAPEDTKGSIGFLSDFRRMNVALTRPRSSMFILGNAHALEKNKLWGNLIKDARIRGCFREVRGSIRRCARYTHVQTHRSTAAHSLASPPFLRSAHLLLERRSPRRRSRKPRASPAS